MGLLIPGSGAYDSFQDRNIEKFVTYPDTTPRESTIKLAKV